MVCSEDLTGAEREVRCRCERRALGRLRHGTRVDRELDRAAFDEQLSVRRRAPLEIEDRRTALRVDEANVEAAPQRPDGRLGLDDLFDSGNAESALREISIQLAHRSDDLSRELDALERCAFEEKRRALAFEKRGERRTDRVEKAIDWKVKRPIAVEQLHQAVRKRSE